MAKAARTSNAPTAHQKLAAVADGIRYDDLPPEVVKFTKQIVLDSLGCLLGGLHGKPATAVRSIVERTQAGPAASVIGTATRTSPELAALANGTALRYLDFNDSYSSGYKEGRGNNTAHPSGNLAAALAVAEAEDCSGRDLIAAMVAGYEVQLRVCDFAGDVALRKRGWHNTCTLAFSTPVIAARLMGGDAATMAHAIAISASHQNTLAQLQEGSLAAIKATADGWIAKGGIEAANLAALGLTGPEEIFEGKAGWTSSVAGGMDYDGLLAPLNGSYRISRARIKPFAAVGPSMAMIQAAVDIHDEGRATPEKIDKIVVGLPESVFENVITHEERRYPATKEAADHSLFYCAVIALLEGNCSEPQYEPHKLTDPKVKELLAKVTLVTDPEFTANQGKFAGGGVKVTLKDGSTIEKRYPKPPGHPANPLTDDQIARKFDGLAEEHYSAAQRDAIKAAVRSLESCERISDLTDKLRPTKTH
jgi:2-methylcitrate dehydratase